MKEQIMQNEDICGLFDDALKVPSGVGNVDARETLFDIMGDIRETLQDELQIELSESMELQYLHYQGDDTSASGGGGFYKRHLDHTADDNGKELIRRISLLLYLNTDEWSEKDGGLLRAYIKQSAKGDRGLTQQQDVIPTGGRLVLFDSATVEHEVLPTNKERWAIVGWFMTDTTEEEYRRKDLFIAPRAATARRRRRKGKSGD